MRTPRGRQLREVAQSQINEVQIDTKQNRPKAIAAILEQPVIEKILVHLGLQARAPPRAPACGQALQAA